MESCAPRSAVALATDLIHGATGDQAATLGKSHASKYFWVVQSRKGHLAVINLHAYGLDSKLSCRPRAANRRNDSALALAITAASSTGCGRKSHGVQQDAPGLHVKHRERQLTRNGRFNVLPTMQDARR